LAQLAGTTTFTPQLPQIFRSQHGHVVNRKPVFVSPQRSQTFEDTLSTAAAPAWVAARAAMDPDRMADRPMAPSISIVYTCARRVMTSLDSSLSHVSKGNPSALVNVCIWFVSRAYF